MDLHNEKQMFARHHFYEWEKQHYPNGDSPYSDDDIQKWVDGFIGCWDYLNSLQGANHAID